MPRLLTGLLCALLLAACHTTRFESRPQAGYASCDKAWVGSWQVTQTSAAGTIEHLGVVDIPAECRPIQLHETGKETEAFDDYSFDYGRVGDLQLLVGTQKADKTPGFLVFRYDADDDRIAVFEIDHVLVAQRILDGTLTGHSAISNQVRPGQSRPHTDSIENMVEGSSEAIAALLAREPELFSAQPVLMLQRTHDEATLP